VKPSRNLIRKSFYIRAAHARTLRKVAAKSGVTASDVVRAALERFFRASPGLKLSLLAEDAPVAPAPIPDRPGTGLTEQAPSL
jgi:hypothetical protein